MSDKELFKAIKEYEEKNNLKEVREINKVLRKIRDICREKCNCKSCEFIGDEGFCKLAAVPENWEI